MAAYDDSDSGPASAKIISSNNILSKNRKKKDSKSAPSSSAPSSSVDLTGEGTIPSFHSGGKVRKTGLARLKKGERVMTKGQQKRMKMRGKSR